MENKKTKGNNLRNTVLGMLDETLEKGRLSTYVLKDFYNSGHKYGAQEKGFIISLYSGTLEKLIYIDFITECFSKIKISKMKPVIRNILRLSVYQIIFMESVPERAALSEALKLCELRGLYGLKGFVNGVLRSVCRDWKNIAVKESTEYCFYDWLYELMISQYGRQDAKKYFEAVNKYDNRLTVRLHTKNADEETVIESLKKDGCDVRRIEGVQKALRISGFSSFTELEAFKKGSISAQDISSMLVLNAALPQKPGLIADVCAAPGGKSMLFADTFPDAQIISMDISESKINLIEENISRMGYQNITPVENNALKAIEEYKGKADTVICDVPCSGLGVIGKKPDIRLNITKERLEELVPLQRKILKESAKYVKPGGLLIYSTCTINKEENEENADWFAAEEPEFKYVSLEGKIPEALLSGSQIKDLETGKLQLLNGVNETDGFFLALFQRQSEKQ